MRFLIFSDTHGDTAALERLMDTEADYYIAAGDLTSWQRGMDRCGEILRSRGERVWVLPGNHESPRQIAEFCSKFGLRDFHEKAFEAGGYHLAGLGCSNPTPFHTPGEYTEEELALRLTPIAKLSPLILVCHCPPLGTPLDRIRLGLHAGSRAVREFLERSEPDAFFCGHIHEAEGVQTRLGRTLAVNVGKRGYLLDTAKLEK